MKNIFLTLYLKYALLKALFLLIKAYADETSWWWILWKMLKGEYRIVEAHAEWTETEEESEFQVAITTDGESKNITIKGTVKWD